MSNQGHASTRIIIFLALVSSCLMGIIGYFIGRYSAQQDLLHSYTAELLSDQVSSRICLLYDPEGEEVGKVSMDESDEPVDRLTDRVDDNEYTDSTGHE